MREDSRRFLPRLPDRGSAAKISPSTSFHPAARCAVSRFKFSLRNYRGGKPMRGKSQLSKSILCSIALATAVALVPLFAVVPALAQNPVPPTARQTAAMPQYASRLAHPAAPAAGKRRASAPSRHRTPSPQDQVIYDNGPVNGTTDAWTINFGYIVSDSISLRGNTVTGFDFYTWEFPGDVLSSVDWSI